MELLKMSGNSRYPSLGVTGAAVLQVRDEVCSANTENGLGPVAIVVQWVASSVLPLLCSFKESQFSWQADLLYVWNYYYISAPTRSMWITYTKARIYKIFSYFYLTASSR